MKSYNPEGPAGTLQYDDFLVYAKSMEKTVTFQEWKIVQGIKLPEAYEKFKSIVALRSGQKSPTSEKVLPHSERNSSNIDQTKV